VRFTEELRIVRLGVRGACCAPTLDRSLRFLLAYPIPLFGCIRFFLEALEDAGGAHASAYAHGDHAVACVFALEVADQGGG
jgi:hypothetical protein